MPGFKQIHFKGHNLGNVNPYNGFLFFSPTSLRWIQERTGEAQGFRGLTGRSFRHSNLSAFASMDLEMDFKDLPERAVMAKVLASFRGSFVSSLFPILDPLAFEETIQLVYSGPEACQEQYRVTNARASVYALLALSSLLCLPTGGVVADDHRRYALVAQSLLPVFMIEAATVDGLEAILLMVSGGHDLLGPAALEY